MTTTLDPAALDAAYKSLGTTRMLYVEKAEIGKAITTYLASLSPRDGEAVVVKGLEWYPDPGAFPAPMWGAQSAFGRYTIEEVSASDSPAYQVRYTPFHLVAVKDDLEAAKDAAQADFDRRIRSAVIASPAPSGEVREALLAARSELEEYEQAATGESYNSPRLNAAIAALSSKGETPEGEWKSMDSAPKDGTFVILKVRPGIAENDGWTPFADSSDPYVTIGFNALRDTGEDQWQFAGWDWCHDCFTDGAGTVEGWMPFAAPKDKEGAK